MGFFKGLAKVILVVSFTLVMIGAIAGISGYYYLDNNVIPFLQDKYDKLERYDTDALAAHNIHNR